MKSAANSVFLLLITLTLATTSRAAMTVRDVAVEGSADRLWVAEVIRPDELVPTAERTRVYWTPVPDDWQRPMLIGSGVRDLSHRGNQLVTLLKTGEWMFVWPDGRSSGPALPGGDMLTVGSDNTTIYAVGRVPGGINALATSRPTTEPAPAEATTQESTEPAAATTRTAATATPTTGPVKLVLFHLDKSTWIADGELPDAIPPTTGQLSIDVVRGRLYAAAILGGEVAVFSRDPSGTWSDAGRLKQQGTPFTRAKVMDGVDRPIVWAAPVAGGGTLYVGTPGDSHAWADPVELRVPSADLSQPLPRDVTIVAQRIRMVFAKGDKLYAQSFHWRTGEPLGKAVTIVAANAAPDARFGLWLNAAVMGVLLLVMAAAMRRRGEIEEAVRHADRIPLAPLGLRFAAAIVDMWPQWVAGAYLQTRVQTPADFEASLTDPMTVRIMTIAFGVYLLHTMVMELLVGASVGKLIFGLRVVLLNGDRPSAGSMFVRNLLRAIDAGFLFVGLIMIVMSPLRQRTGDLAAGTIVVRKTALKEPAATDELVTTTTPNEE